MSEVIYNDEIKVKTLHELNNFKIEIQKNRCKTSHSQKM